MSSLPPLRPARPLAAFLAGRQRRRDRERQETLDAAALESQSLQDTLTRFQIGEIAGAPAERRRLADQANRQLASRKAAVIPQIAGLEIEPEVRRVMIARVGSATTPDELNDALKAIDAQIKPQREPLVQIGEGETAANKAFGKPVGEATAERNKQALATTQEDRDLERLELALSRGAQTGRGEETILELKNLGNTLFGLELTEADEEGEVVRAIGSRLALLMRNPDAGLGLPGSTSNRDLDFLVGAVNGLQQSEEGNRLLIKYRRRQNQMKRDLAKEQSRIIRENNGEVPLDLDSLLLDFADNYDFLTEEEKEEIRQVSGGNVPVTDRFIGSGPSIEELPGFDELTPEEQEEARRLDALARGNNR